MKSLILWMAVGLICFGCGRNQSMENNRAVSGSTTPPPIPSSLDGIEPLDTDNNESVEPVASSSQINLDEIRQLIESLIETLFIDETGPLAQAIEALSAVVRDNVAFISGIQQAKPLRYVGSCSTKTVESFGADVKNSCTCKGAEVMFVSGVYIYDRSQPNGGISSCVVLKQNSNGVYGRARADANSNTNQRTWCQFVCMAPI